VADSRGRSAIVSGCRPSPKNAQSSYSFLQVLLIVAIHFFVLQGFDKRLAQGIVIDIAPPAHTDLNPVLLEQVGVMARRVLRVEKFKLSHDPKFEEKVRDIVGLYLNPPDRALVLCVGEKSQIQALDRTRPLLPLRPGLPERQTHDYKRYGTTTLFAAFNILNGKVMGSCRSRHRSREFLSFLQQLEKTVPADLEIHLILDYYSTHKSQAVQRWLQPKKRQRFHLHSTPTSSSWLNQVERWFALITDRMIRRGTFLSVRELEQAIYEWLAKWSHDPQPFVWKATADVILDKVRRCKELYETAHQRCPSESRTGC